MSIVREFVELEDVVVELSEELDLAKRDNTALRAEIEHRNSQFLKRKSLIKALLETNASLCLDNDNDRDRLLRLLCSVL